MEQNMVIDNISHTISDTIKDLVKTETVVGKPFHLGEFEVVPVLSVSVGFGTGGGSGNGMKNGPGSGGGGGAGVKVEPIAFLVARKDQIELINLGKGRGMEAAMEAVPQVISEAGQVLKDLIHERGKNDEKNNTQKPEGTTETKFTHG